MKKNLKKDLFQLYQILKIKEIRKRKFPFNFPENVIELFSFLPELKKEYGSYSACAIKKLLPVMRCGKYWDEGEIAEEIKIELSKSKNA